MQGTERASAEPLEGNAKYEKVRDINRCAHWSPLMRVSMFTPVGGHTNSQHHMGLAHAGAQGWRRSVFVRPAQTMQRAAKGLVVQPHM